VHGLAEKAEAVKLVEDFEADAVAFDARAGVGDFEDGSWLVDFAELGGGDYLVADWVGVSLLDAMVARFSRVDAVKAEK
jgi:hypothetical protein